MEDASSKLREMVEIENRTYQGDDREDDDHASYYLINNKDAVGVKLTTDFIDQPRQAKPPEQGTEDDAQIPHSHLQWHIGHHEGKLSEGRHEEEHDERIGQRDEECRDAVVQQRALLVAALVHVLGRIALEAIDTENQKKQAAENLKIKLVLRIVDEIHHETHAQTCEERIHDVAASGTDARHKTIPTPLVQGALNTQYAHRSHWSRGNNTYDNTLENEIKNVYLYWKH